MTTLIEHWELLGILATRAQADVIQRDCDIAELKNHLAQRTCDLNDVLLRLDHENKRPTWTCGECEACFNGYPSYVTPGPDGTPRCDRCAKAGAGPLQAVPRTDADRERVWCPRIGGLVDTCRHGYGSVCSSMCEKDRTDHINQLTEAICTGLEDQADELSRNDIYLTIRAVLAESFCSLPSNTDGEDNES